MWGTPRWQPLQGGAAALRGRGISNGGGHIFWPILFIQEIYAQIFIIPEPLAPWRRASLAVGKAIQAGMTATRPAIRHCDGAAAAAVASACCQMPVFLSFLGFLQAAAGAAGI